MTDPIPDDTLLSAFRQVLTQARKQARREGRGLAPMVVPTLVCSAVGAGCIAFLEASGAADALAELIPGASMWWWWGLQFPLLFGFLVVALSSRPCTFSNARKWAWAKTITLAGLSIPLATCWRMMFFWG